jgi:hypothetical protein
MPTCPSRSAAGLRPADGAPARSHAVHVGAAPITLTSSVRGARLSTNTSPSSYGLATSKPCRAGLLGAAGPLLAPPLPEELDTPEWTPERCGQLVRAGCRLATHAPAPAAAPYTHSSSRTTELFKGARHSRAREGSSSYQPATHASAAQQHQPGPGDHDPRNDVLTSAKRAEEAKHLKYVATAQRV